MLALALQAGSSGFDSQSLHQIELDVVIYQSKSNQDTNTLCPRCNIEMGVGIGIDYNNRGSACTGFGTLYLNHRTLKVIDCLKCPKCGYSDDLR